MTNESYKNLQEPFLNGDQQVTVSHIYKLNKEHLKKLFIEASDDLQQQLASLQEHGSVKGIQKKLASDAGSGIVGDEKDLKRRITTFGVNRKPISEPPTLLKSIQTTADDKIWWVVIGSAILSGIFGGIAHGWGGLLEGVAIVIATFTIICVTSTADYFKDKSFVNLQSLVKEEKIAVIRGKFGSTMSISVWDLVVGDVILLEAGSRIPADSLIIESSDAQVDEGQHNPDEDDFSQGQYKRKSLHEDPFLYADSLFVRGTCKALVCCVGDNCVRRNSVTKYDTTTDTRLKKKLDNLGSRFTLYSIYATIFILICLIIALSIQLGTRTDAEAKANPIGTIILAKISKIVVFIVVILVVCIPEGLPMTIEVALAFSVNRMFKDKILVRNLSAPEYMGSVEEICCGKTGTITMNNMKVSQFNCEGRQVKNTRKDTLLHCELSTNTVELIKESILYNCEARIEMDATSYIPVGNGTEVALLKFLQDAEVPVHLLIQRKLGRIRAISPFSSEKKRSAVALECPDRPQRVAVYVKGAPEVIINLCHSIAGARGSGMFGNDEKARMLDTVASMASNPLRVISFAFTEMDLEDWLALEGRGGTPERALEDALSNGALALTFIGAFGLRDPLRPSVSSAVKYARDSGKLWVRLVSGDHIETAKAVALKSGILRAEEAGRLYSVMSAEDFRQTVGQIIEDDGIGMPNVENEMAFKEIIANLRVLARATAADKLLLVTGLKALGKCVSVTGDGINDVVALERADVGLAMGSGCSAAKESSDIILTDDDFEASLRAVMWGRNIFHNISRFLQFQLTVNISVVITIFIGICTFAESPLSPVQLLWINLIMDTFAAFALSTEPPLPSVIKGSPFKQKASILSATVWRQILGISFWNSLVMLILICFGSMMFNLDYTNSTNISMLKPSDYNTTGTLSANDMLYDQSQAKLLHYTYIFNTFVFLQVFNQVNCRKIGRKDFNVFEKIFHNYFFLAVIIGVSTMQVAMVQFFPAISQTTPMTRSQWGACIAVGSSPLVISMILKLTPDTWVKKLGTVLLNEDEEVDSAVLSAWNATQAKPGEGKAIAQEDENYAALTNNSEGEVDDFAAAP